LVSCIYSIVKGIQLIQNNDFLLVLHNLCSIFFTYIQVAQKCKNGVFSEFFTDFRTAIYHKTPFLFPSPPKSSVLAVLFSSNTHVPDHPDRAFSRQLTRARVCCICIIFAHLHKFIFYLQFSLLTNHILSVILIIEHLFCSCPVFLVNEYLCERMTNLPNLLCRFEALRSDKTLLEAQKIQLDVIVNDYGENDERVCGIRTSIKMLEDRLCQALKELDVMVESAKSPKDACRLSDERLFLTYRYLHDLTMEQTAEAMHVSRDTVYRIRRRILSRSYTH